MTMTPKDRVMTALAHRKPDRVPMALGGSYYGLTDPLYFALLDHFGLPRDDTKRFRRRGGRSITYHDDRVLDALGIDVRYVWLGSTDLISPDFSALPDGAEAKNAFGVAYRKTGERVQMLFDRSPIDLGGDIDRADPALMERYALPDPASLVRIDELRARLEVLAGSPCAIVARSPVSYGIFEQAGHLVGVTNMMMGFLTNPDFLRALLGKLNRFYMDLMRVYLDVAGAFVDVVELPGDDFSGTHMSMVSPAMYDDFFLEPYREMVLLVREKAPRAKVLFHSDGNITEFIPKFIAAGADIIHCLETNVGNDAAQAKCDYGDKVAFWGALDIKHALQAGPEAIRRDIDAKMAALKPGGGWIFAPENHIQSDVPPEHVVFAFQYAAEQGRYAGC